MRSKSIGDLAERAASRKYGLENTTDRTGFYDAKHQNGRKVQIKAAMYQRARGGPGVIRIWKHHLQKLSEVNGSVVVVVVNPSNITRKVLKIQKFSPKELLRIGDFRPTGQEAMKPAKEARIPWTDLMELH